MTAHVDCPSCKKRIDLTVSIDARDKPLTTREAQVKRAIAILLHAGTKPSLRSVARTMSLREDRLSHISDWLRGLERKGHLRREGNKWTILIADGDQ